MLICGRDCKEPAYIDEFKPTKRDKWANNYRGAFNNWVYPVIGDKLVHEITAEDVLAVLRQKIIGEGDFLFARTPTALKTRGRIERILNWAADPGRRYRPNGVNPAARSSVGTLPNPSEHAEVESHAALSYHRMPAFMKKLTSSVIDRAAAIHSILRPSK